MPLFESMGTRFVRGIVFGTSAAILALAALGVGAAALYLALIASVSPAAALAIIAGLLALLAVIAGIVAIGRRRPAVPQPLAPELTALLPEAADLVRRAVSADPTAAVMGAVAAGFILESRPGLDVGHLARLFAQFRR